MTFKSKLYLALAGVLLSTGAAVTVQAQSAIVTFSVDMATNIALGTFTPGSSTLTVNGTFNGWGTGTPLVQEGSGTVYTNTVADSGDAVGGVLDYKFVEAGNYESLPTGQNRAVRLPATNGASLVLPTPFFNDAGAPVTNIINFQVDISQQINLGNFTPGTSSVEVRGLFNSWAGGATPLIQSSITVSGEPAGSVWTGAVAVASSPAAAEAFKYVIQPNTLWDSPSAVNSDGGGNRYFFNVPQTLPLVDFSDQPFSTQFCTNLFSVDMSVINLVDTNFNPASLAIEGSFNGWGTGIPMTNNPTAANTNIYTSSQIIYSAAGSSVQYLFIYTLLSAPGTTVYDHLDGVNGGSGNRVFTEPLSVTFTNVPPVYFNDAVPDDYLTQPTPVLFTVDMTGAVGTTASDSHVFDSTQDGLYINGQFANWYAWAGGIDPASAPPGYRMMQVGSSQIFTNTVIIPAGTPIGFAYKYGMDPGNANGGPNDDEAASGANHYRVVRATAFNPYVMPQDKFGYQYSEPFFSSAGTTNADLSIGSLSGGKAPISWLGRPGARLQTATNILSGSWQTIAATDGTNWTIGYSSTNGFVSTTNWPATNTTFFRIIKP